MGSTSERGLLFASSTSIGHHQTVEVMNENTTTPVSAGIVRDAAVDLGSLECQCFVCKRKVDENDDRVRLKCVECGHRSHLRCAYKNSTVPENLRKLCPMAISNWRCYDCKRCHLCGRNEDADGLLLCDGCDSGEHMRCQQPPLTDVPPAPWFCSLCRPRRAPNDQSAANQLLSQVIEEKRDDRKPPINVSDGVSFPECPSQPAHSTCTDGQLKSTEPISPPLVKLASPNGGQGPAAPDARSPCHTRIGKRTAGGNVDKGHTPSAPRRRRPATTIAAPAGQTTTASITSIRRPANGALWGNCAVNGFESRQFNREKEEEAEFLPFLLEDLPSLNDEIKAVKSARLWSVEEAASFMAHMGYNDGASAFRREDIDGAALLLLRRQDVLTNLGLKLGPALKTYKFVRYIQSIVGSQ